MVTKVTAKKVAFGLEEKVAGALCYVLFWLSGLVFLLAEKENKTIRFHALQSLIFFGGLHILIVLSLGILLPLVLVVGFIGWLYSIYKAYNGEDFELPLAGKLAKKQLAKMK